MTDYSGQIPLPPVAAPPVTLDAVVRHWAFKALITILIAVSLSYAGFVMNRMDDKLSMIQSTITTTNENASHLGGRVVFLESRATLIEYRLDIQDKKNVAMDVWQNRMEYYDDKKKSE